eukprot:CAMPEP_0202957872 /NCGR_PEP_ID=MMETSP1396-20130829/2253_1 /ASSEMBLY_ACC=CAM_ASM_000872 /TAXON_ID= /ORGANISM="Pseudokeronopsis sp., Strain Brazil" /LENGTH=61 /DNA_ID=CAMNT_0049675599 /DNA_START=890 /DNA_END=1075 /DNA_ORIENTATION=-
MASLKLILRDHSFAKKIEVYNKKYDDQNDTITKENVIFALSSVLIPKEAIKYYGQSLKEEI